MAWKDVRETVGVLSVLAGLVFVGAEIRQTNQLARGQARQALADQNQEWLLYLSEDTAAYAIYTKVWSTEGDVTEMERRRGRLLMIATLRRSENVYLQYAEGLVDESALASYGVRNSQTRLGTPRFDAFWFEEDSRSTFDPAFVEFFESAGR